MRRFLLAAVPAFAAALLAIPSQADDEPQQIHIEARRQREVQETRTVLDPATGVAKIVTVTRAVPTTVTYAINPAKCAVVVCDMWDDHWCKNVATNSPSRPNRC